MTIPRLRKPQRFEADEAKRSVQRTFEGLREIIERRKTSPLILETLVNVGIWFW
jgi:hypothetical protein